MRAALRLLTLGLVGWAVAGVLLLSARSAQAEFSPLRGAMDNIELERWRTQTPAAVTLVTQGEAALASGDFKAALADFDAAKKLVPVSQLLSRRRCQTLGLLRERQAALDACSEAIKLSRFGPALPMRASVSALMSTPTLTLDDLAIALFYADQATSTASNLPWGYAANCDIAYRLGDYTRLTACQRALSLLAPNHYETERAARLRVAEMPLLAKVIWGILAMLSIFTLGHFLVSTRRNATLRATLNRATRVTLLLGLLLVPTLAHAGDEPSGPPLYHGLSKWPVNPADPVSSVPTAEQRDANPLEYGYHVMDLADLAGAAVKRGDFTSAAKFYEATVKADPGTAVGYRNACLYYEKSGNLEQALSFCRSALARQGVMASDYVRYSDLVISEPSAITKEQVEDLQGIVEHLKTEGNPVASAQVECDLATRVDDSKRLEHCVQVLTQLAPNDPKTLSLAWARAIRRGEIDEAQRLVARAKNSGMKPEGIQTMELATSAELRLPRRVARHWPAFLVSTCSALAAVGIALMMASKRRSRTVAG